MKVLHLVAGELNGGAARGAYWLHQALRDLEVDSTILTNAKDNLGDASVISLADSAIGKLKFAILKRMGQAPVKAYRRRKRVIFNTGFDGVDFTRHPAYASADLVHLHWVNGLVSTRALRKLKKPVIWTLRDMWAFTGGCHYSMDCEQFMQGCGKCPQLGSSRVGDLSRFIVRHKRASVPKDIRIVGISRWLSDCASRSTVLRGCRVNMISNNVDTRMFSPFPKDHARQELGLEFGRKIVLIGAGNVADFYKGFDLFLEALESLRKENVHVVMFGRSIDCDLDSLGVQSTSLGYLSETDALRVAYSAADVFVAPSRMDAFGKTLVEAMSCGTPVVCFDATGPKDIVEHQVTGYRATPFNPQDLAHGIQWVLNEPPDAYQALCRNARERAEQRFDSRVIARQYEALYREALADANPDTRVGLSSRQAN
jgi:glycosyltransferase involved in cell wall biosynthesis